MASSMPANEWLLNTLNQIATDLGLDDNGIVSPVRHGVTGLNWAIVFRQYPENERVQTLDGSSFISAEFEVELHSVFNVRRTEPTTVPRTAKEIARGSKSSSAPQKVDRTATTEDAKAAIAEINSMSDAVKNMIWPIGGDVVSEYDESYDRSQQTEGYLSRFLVVSLPPMIAPETI